VNRIFSHHAAQGVDNFPQYINEGPQVNATPIIFRELLNKILNAGVGVDRDTGDGEAPGDEEQDQGYQLQGQPLPWLDLLQAMADMVTTYPETNHPRNSRSQTRRQAACISQRLLRT